MKWITNLPCTCCGATNEGGNTIHHLYTQGAYPELKFEKWNHCPLCKDCHVRIHKIGTRDMGKIYRNLVSWLESNDWYKCELTGKWRHE